MPRRFQLMVSLAVPLLLVSALAPSDARAQSRASPLPPGNPFVAVADTSAPRPAQVHHPDEERSSPAATEPAFENRPDTGTAARSGDAPEPPPPEPPPPALEDAMRALDEVLSGDERDPIAGAEHVPEPDVRSAGLPSRAETAAAIESVMPSVRACATDHAGAVVDLRIVFTSSGRVTTASVQTRSARLSPGQRSCVARAARRARIAAFERARFEVTYPLRL